MRRMRPSWRRRSRRHASRIGHKFSNGIRRNAPLLPDGFPAWRNSYDSRREMPRVPRGYQLRKVLCPWNDLEPSDLCPQGPPETVVRYKHQELLGLIVKGQALKQLGMLAIRCEFDSMGEPMPISMALAEDTLLEAAKHTPMTGMKALLQPSKERHGKSKQ
mgnify:FL=1